MNELHMSKSAGEDPAPADLHLPRTLLLIAGIIIILTQPTYLAIDGQLFPAIVGGPKKFYFNVLIGLSVFNVLLGATLLSILRFRWLRLRWRTVTWLVWALLTLSCAVMTRRGGYIDGFVELVISVLIVNSMMCECSRLWFGSLSAVSIAAFAWLLMYRPVTAMEWFILIIGVVVAHCGQEMSIHSRREAGAARAELEAKMVELDIAEQRARQSKENLKRIIQYAPDVIAINRYSDGRFILVNQEFERRFDRTDALGRTPPEMKLVVPRATMTEVMKELAQKGVMRDVEFNYRKHDGTLEHYLASFILAEMNGEKCVITFARDVTAIKEIERKLRESEAMMRKIFDDSSDPMTVIDAETNTLINANNAFLRFSALTSKEGSN
jgi:PAS domain S-box-containing protein